MYPSVPSSVCFLLKIIFCSFSLKIVFLLTTDTYLIWGLFFRVFVEQDKKFNIKQQRKIYPYTYQINAIYVFTPALCEFSENYLSWKINMNDQGPLTLTNGEMTRPTIKYSVGQGF